VIETFTSTSPGSTLFAIDAVLPGAPLAEEPEPEPELPEPNGFKPFPNGLVALGEPEFAAELPQAT